MERFLFFLLNNFYQLEVQNFTFDAVVLSKLPSLLELVLTNCICPPRSPLGEDPESSDRSRFVGNTKYFGPLALVILPEI